MPKHTGTSIEEFDAWLKQMEGTRLEFKTAASSFSADKDLPDYCAALANEGGGKLVLGVSPDRRVVGTKAFQGTHNRLPHALLTKLKIRIDVEELLHPKGRVLIFHVPPHPPEQPVRSTGKYAYPMRAGESLVEMDLMTLKALLNETSPDFSGLIVPAFTVMDLDETAMRNFRKMWAQKANRLDYRDFTDDKMLKNIGLLTGQGLNYAALVLLGKKEKIDRLLPGSEIIFEWRQDAKKIPHDYRVNWREPFFKIFDEIWNTVNARNLRMPFQEGLFQREVYAFSEKPIREALLNAVAHRDYTIFSQSIFISASPEAFVIESPGGFLPGITPENVLYKREWRNRCIAETLEKAGLVERAGQGMDDIFENTIREGKGLPDLSGSDAFTVQLRIPARVKDKNFILFLEKITKEKQITLSFEEIYELEKIREEQPVARPRFKEKFLQAGIIEKTGRTRGTKYLLAHQYYTREGKPGVYTRLVGLSRNQKKELILNHLWKNKKGCMKDFQDVFPDLRRSDIHNLLQELKKAGQIVRVGTRQSGYWTLQESN